MTNSFQKSTKKFDIGAALWDGFIYPLRCKEIIRLFVFFLIYFIVLGVIFFIVLGVFIIFIFLGVFTVQFFDASFIYAIIGLVIKISPIKDYLTGVVFYELACFIYAIIGLVIKIYPIKYYLTGVVFSELAYTCIGIILFLPLNGYTITIIQNSLKDNDKLPRLKLRNFRTLFVLGIKAGIIILLTDIITLPLIHREVENPVLLVFLSSVVPFLPLLNSIVIAIFKINTSISYFLIFLYLLLVPSMFVTFARHGCLSDLLPISQYYRYLKDINYIQIAILFNLIDTVPGLYLSYYETSERLFPIILFLVFYLSLVSKRIIGKQWKNIKKQHGHRKLLCDATIQTKIDKYLER